MRKLSLIFMAIMLHCSKSDSFYLVKDMAEKMDGANAVVRNFTALGYTAKDKVWELIADEAYMYSDTDLTYVFTVDLDYYKNGKKSTKVYGNKGLLNNREGTLRIDEEVRVFSSNGRKLYTDYLTWYDKEQVLDTDAPVTITFPEGDVIKGVGMRADQKLEKWVLKSGRAVH